MFAKAASGFGKAEPEIALAIYVGKKKIRCNDIRINTNIISDTIDGGADCEL